MCGKYNRLEIGLMFMFINIPNLLSRNAHKIQAIYDRHHKVFCSPNNIILTYKVNANTFVMLSNNEVSTSSLFLCVSFHP